MKKTYNINLGNRVFCIDEDAYQQLRNYISALERHYLSEEDGKEIMTDIESRVAELFTDFLQKNHKEVITQEDIDKIIEIMGTPDVIIDEDSNPESVHRVSRKLYRDVDNSVFGGVAAGIAAYFSISSAWIRLAFIIFCFFYGITLLVYIVLWIVLPKAVTAKQKLEMKGEKINVSNIEKNIRDTYNDVKKNTSFQKFLQRFKQITTDILNLLGRIFGRIFTTLMGVLSFIGILGGTFLFILVFWLLLFPEHIPWFNDYCTLYYIISPSTFTILKIILLLIIEIPLLIIVYTSAQYLFRYNWNRTFLLSSLGCWFLAGIAGILIAVQQSLQFSGTQRATTTHALVPADTVLHKYTLVIRDFANRQANRTSDIYYEEGPFDIITLDTLPPQEIYLKAPIRIEQSYNSVPALELKKSSRGFRPLRNQENLNTIRYNWEQEGNHIYLDNYFQLTKPVWRAQCVRATLFIPENDTLVIRGNPKSIENSFRSPLLLSPMKEEYMIVMKNGQPEIIPD